MLSQEDLVRYLEVLEIKSYDITNLSLKQVSSAFQKLALLKHPDKVGDESTAAFQQLHEAYEKIRSHLKNNSELNRSTGNNFFDDNFESFNFPYENRGSFTVKIEDALAFTWNECLTVKLGNPTVKTNNKGTETDRFWKLNYRYENDIEITIHLYMNPKNKKGSKILVQAGVQSAICAYVFNELPAIYNKVCAAKLKALPDKSEKPAKALVKCSDCHFTSTLVQMKHHIRNSHGRKFKAQKRSSILTPLPNPSKRVKASLFSVMNSEITLDESMLSVGVKDDATPANLIDEVSERVSCTYCPFEAENKEILGKHKCEVNCVAYKFKYDLVSSYLYNF